MPSTNLITETVQRHITGQIIILREHNNALVGDQLQNVFQFILKYHRQNNQGFLSMLKLIGSTKFQQDFVFFFLFEREKEQATHFVHL